MKSISKTSATKLTGNSDHHKMLTGTKSRLQLETVNK